MRKAKIYYHNRVAGILTETSDGEYIFQYKDEYTQAYSQQFINFTMPVRKVPYMANRLFPFFEGLIPEGWLLDIASNNWKINPNDRMGLLLACCKNCIGAVSVIPIPQEDE
ncbi:MAG: phosphatidylinositol kinase [Bacteroidales bacterium]|nr:phosphatidylinositol kinase [Bacteroidales bacterium]